MKKLLRKYIKNIALLLSFCLMISLLTACDKKESEYVLKDVFSYDDIQESKTRKASKEAEKEREDEDSDEKSEGTSSADNKKDNNNESGLDEDSPDEEELDEEELDEEEMKEQDETEPDEQKTEEEKIEEQTTEEQNQEEPKTEENKTEGQNQDNQEIEEQKTEEQQEENTEEETEENTEEITEQPNNTSQDNSSSQQSNNNIQDNFIDKTDITPQPDDTPHQAETPSSGNLGGDTPKETENNGGQNAGDEGDTIPDQSSSGGGEDAGESTGDGSGENIGGENESASQGDAIPDTPTITPEEPDTTEETEEPEEPVQMGLEYEGTLGRYIWGETPDTSKLHIYYTEGTKKTEIKSYSISMDYPALNSVHFTNAPTSQNDFYAFESPYTPGIYNATVVYGDYYCEVPYELDLVYVAVEFYMTSYCTDYDVHSNELAVDENGNYIEELDDNGKAAYGSSFVLDWVKNDSTFSNLHFCKNCHCNTSTETRHSFKNGEFETYEVTRYSPILCGWMKCIPLYYDYTFDQEDFDNFGVELKYLYHIEYDNEKITADKDSLMNDHYDRDYYYCAGDYAHIYTAVPEDADVEW